MLSPQGTPAQNHLAWLAGEFELVISPQLISELKRAFGYQKLRDRADAQDAEDFIGILQREATLAADPSSPPSVNSRDPGDDYLLALAEFESAALVSGDSDLLEVNGGLPIYSPRQFLELLQREHRN